MSELSEETMHRALLRMRDAERERDRAIQERDVALQVSSESFREALTGPPGLAELAGVTVTPDMANFRIQDAIAVQLKAQQPLEAAAKSVLTCCRQCRDEAFDKGEADPAVPAEFILWGRLFDSSALGPKCYDHAQGWIGWGGMGQINQYAVVDLRPIRAALEGL